MNGWLNQFSALPDPQTLAPPKPVKPGSGSSTNWFGELTRDGTVLC
jgi:hypothetical protein